MLKTKWQLRMHKKKYTLNLGMCNSDHLKEESTKRYGLDCIDSIRKQRLLFGRDCAELQSLISHTTAKGLS